MTTTNNQPVMTKKQLIKAFFAATFIGCLVLVTAVLPAEYNIDPLGTGKLFGFSKLYIENAPPKNDSIAVQLPIKQLSINHVGSPAYIDKPLEASNPPPARPFAQREDTILVTVPAEKGIEYKVKMLKYGSTKYDWATDNGILYIDFHGEVKEANPPEEVFYESYTLAYSNNMAGTLTAPFEGKHGWYFKNMNKHDIVVTIHLKGEYELFGKK